MGLVDATIRAYDKDLPVVVKLTQKLILPTSEWLKRIFNLYFVRQVLDKIIFVNTEILLGSLK